MVATDQGTSTSKPSGLFSMLDEEEKKRLADLGRAAAVYAQQPINAQMIPVQFGGGLLQMMPVPEMQYGVGMMGYQPSGENGDNVDKMKNLMKIMKALGMGA